ncbi:hypothetical protein BOSEA1005_10416 [Hyphomicrobiales bacterium]|nr:hypothetical protein BOSEA1005_10416 [Hyphomicrobiales bacterium]
MAWAILHSPIPIRLALPPAAVISSTIGPSLAVSARSMLRETRTYAVMEEVKTDGALPL